MLGGPSVCSAWEPWHTPGGEAEKQRGGGAMRQGDDGAKQHAGGGHAFSGIPTCVKG